MSNSNIKICVVGAGYWGKNHIRSLSELNSLGAVVESDKNQIVEKKKDEKIIINEDNENIEDNIIYNLSYKKFDIQNNFYQVEALESTIKENNSNLILMKKVKAIIKYLDNENLVIVSENALFNNKTFETNFYNGVELFFEDQKLTGGNLDFIFEKNIAILRDKVTYEKLNTKMFSDKIIFNLLTKEITIKSKNASERVKIEKN